jgi:hypothetical protein
MSKLLQSDLVLMGPTKYLYGDCTIGGAISLIITDEAYVPSKLYAIRENLRSRTV